MLGLPDYEITGIEEIAGRIRISVRFRGKVFCPYCAGTALRMKDRRVRRPRRGSWGVRNSWLELETKKWLCVGCSRIFWQRFPGIQARARASEPFRRSVCQKHFDGISRSRLAKRERISGATVERWFGLSQTSGGRTKQPGMPSDPRDR